MEVQVNRLREALNLLEPVVPRKTTMPILVNVRLGDGRAVATDLDLAVRVDLPEAQEPVLLPMKGALAFLKYAPGYETARITVSVKDTTIAVGDTETRFVTAPPEDYPPVPQFQAEHEGVLDGDALLRALLAVLPCVPREDTRPVLTGVCLATGETVEVAGADGFRLAWETVPGKLVGDGNLIIPGKAVPVLEHLWKKEAAPDTSEISDPVRLAVAKRLVRLGWGKGNLEVGFGRISVLVKLIQGTFPNYRRLVPSGSEPAVTVPAEDAYRALQQVKRVAKDGSGIVRMVWEGEVLRLSARAEDAGETVVRVPATCTGPGKTAANISYLLDYFSGRTGPVTISAVTPSEPIKFQHRGRAHFVMMPMFVAWDGEAAPAPKPQGGTEATAEAGDEAEAEDETETEAPPTAEAPSAEAPKPRRKRRAK